MKPQCNGKNSYDKRSAQTVVNQRNKNGAQIRLYQCKTCPWWHLTSKSKWTRKMYQGM